MRGLTRIIHECFYCNRRCLTQARLAGQARLEVRDAGCEIRDISYPATRIPYPLVALHSAISRRIVMNNAGYGL